MEEQRENKETKSLRLSADTRERLQKLLDKYRNDADPRRDQQENALIRILDIAESESMRGNHPALEPSLIAVESTISTLIKQINGIVSGQDSEMEELRKKLDNAILEKQAMADSVKVSLEEIETQKALFEKTKADTGLQIQAALSERDQAIRERDDARIIATEKSSSNDLLLKQISSMEKDLADFKELQNNYKAMEEKIQKMEQEAIRKAGEAEVEREKAIIAKERELRKEYQEQLREADRAIMRLQIQIEQLQTTK